MKDYGTKNGGFEQDPGLSRGTLRALQEEKKRLSRLMLPVERYERNVYRARNKLYRMIEKNRALTKLRLSSQRPKEIPHARCEGELEITY